MTAVGMTAGWTLLPGTTGGADTIPDLAFDSTGSLLDADGETLTDDSLIAVRAETTASNEDADGNGDAVSYPDGADIPLVAVDGSVVGFGAMLVTDDADFSYGNEEFVLNVWDDQIGGGTVLWDEGHGQFYDLSQFSQFESYAEDRGYTVEATTDLESDLSGADAVVVTSPSDSFGDAEKDALSSFVADGGTVLLHDQSDFDDFDETANLDDIASALDLDFRFNDDQVLDDDNNDGPNYVPTTGRFNESSFDYFDDREGISTTGFQRGETYEATVESVADGDTFTARFEDDSTEEIRVLGVDTPESPDAQQFERPAEWEGLASDARPLIEELAFDSTSSLLDENGDPMSGGDGVLVTAESTASNEDADGNGDAVSYPDGADIPLVAADGTVVGFGAMLVTDDDDTSYGNDEFVRNVWDDAVGGGTVLWDEGHGQFYDLSQFSNFESSVEEAGYTVEATTDLESDLADADAAVVTSPSDSFDDSELSALSSFVDDGGAVFLHDQSDFDDFDETANLDDIASALGVGFRFNDDQVVDDENNTGQSFRPTTTRVTDAFRYGADRAGVDGETPPADYPYLAEWAEKATAFAEDELLEKTVDVSFDDSEPVRDDFDRLLAYVTYDASGDGSRETLYNARLIENGYARVYGSTLSRHEEFWALEDAARMDGAGLWAESDVGAAAPIRDRPVTELFVPDAVAVTTESGDPAADRVPVAAESTASPAEAPLVGTDEANNAAVVGGLLPDEGYELQEGSGYNVAGYGNFTFLANLVDSLADGTGPVLIDGGHGQFGVDYGLSNEDAAYFGRYLEGFDVAFEQTNDVTGDRLADARALLVTTPPEAFTQAERDAVAAFADDGGAVVLLGSGAAPDEATGNLDDLAAAVTDLRVGGQVTDDERNLAGEPADPTTRNFAAGSGLFTAFGAESGEDGDGGGDADETTVSIRFGGPSGPNLARDAATTGDLLADAFPSGLSGFRVTVAVDDTDIVEMAGASYPDAYAPTEEPAVAADGSLVTVKAADADETVQPGAEDVVLAGVDFDARAPGTTDVSITVESMDDDDGSRVPTTTADGTLEVIDLRTVGDGDTPTDPDGDGRYEDVNGNGRIDYDDVVVLFTNKETTAVEDHQEAYDFNDNGRFDFDDVVELSEEVSGD